MAPGLLCSQGPVYSRSQAHSDSETSSLPFSVASLTRNYTMQEFALQYFRKPQTLLDQRDGGAKEKAMAGLVQYTKAPIQESLISLSDEDMNRQAVESFRTLMQFMGDQSKPRDKDEMDLLYELLKKCSLSIYCMLGRGGEPGRLSARRAYNPVGGDGQ